MVSLLYSSRILLPEFRDPGTGHPDLFSAALSLGAVLSVIYGLKQIAEGNLDWLSALAVIAGLVGGTAFIRRQRTLADPLIEPGLFLVFSSASLATNLVSLFAAYGAFLFIARSATRSRVVAVARGPLDGSAPACLLPVP